MSIIYSFASSNCSCSTDCYVRGVDLQTPSPRIADVAFYRLRFSKGFNSGGGLVSTYAQHHVVLIFDILPKIKLFAAAAPPEDLRTLPKTLIGWGYKE